MLAIGIAAVLFLGAVSVAFNVVCFRAIRKRRRRRPEKYKAIKTDWSRVLEDTRLREK